MNKVVMDMPKIALVTNEDGKRMAVKIGEGGSVIDDGDGFVILHDGDGGKVRVHSSKITWLKQ